MAVLTFLSRLASYRLLASFLLKLIRVIRLPIIKITNDVLVHIDCRCDDPGVKKTLKVTHTHADNKERRTFFDQNSPIFLKK